MYAGSVIEDKGVTDLLRAIALLRKRGLEVHCSLAGGGDLNGMANLANQLGISDLISFLGLIGNNDVVDLMRNSDVVAVPSRTHYTEGFPFVLFEAIASRTPIVCSDHPMFRPIFFDRRNASVFRPETVIPWPAQSREQFQTKPCTQDYQMPHLQLGNP